MICETENRFNPQLCLLIFSLLSFSLVFLGRVSSEAIELKITKISPPGGKLTGGTAIEITGINLRDGAKVRIGEKEVPGVVIVDEESEKVIAITPPGSKTGSHNVTVINPDGEESNILKNSFVYADPPTITKIDPEGGFIGGETQITITGINFLSGVEALIGERVKVLIGERKAEIVDIDNSRIVLKSPTGEIGAQDVIVQNIINPDELSDIRRGGFVYASPPEIEKANIPSTGVNPRGGTQIEITGKYFPAQEKLQVLIDGKAATEVFVDGEGTKISAKAPSGSGEVDLKVSNLINPGELSHTLPTAFTYNLLLEVSEINPDSGTVDGGTQILIKGVGFIEPISIKIDDKDTQIIWVSSRRIIAKTPKSEQDGEVNVLITNGDGQKDSSFKFTYTLPLPKITSILPEIGSPSGGTEITINGENFDGVTSVMFGDKSVKRFHEVDSSTIVAITPPGDAGKAMDVVVINRDSQEAKRGFTLVQLVVDKIEPESGPLVGGTTIAISGDGFIEGAVVTIGGERAKEIKVESRNQIIAKTPQGQPGLQDVIIINPNEQEVTPDDQRGEGKFTYYAGFPSDTNIRVYNYPNPIKVGQKTTFRYNPKEDSGTVEIKIFNMAGELMESLSDGDRDGLIPWNDIDIPPGLYPYVFILNGKIEQGQLLLVKRMK